MRCSYSSAKQRSKWLRLTWARSQIAARPANKRPYAWAAAAVLAIGTAAAGLRMLRPDEAAAPVVAASHAGVELADARGRRPDAAIPAAIASRRSNSSAEAGRDLSPRTAAPPSLPPRDPQWIEHADHAPTSDLSRGTARNDLSPGTAAATAPAEPDLAAGADGRPAPRKLSPETAREATGDGEAVAAASAGKPAKTSPEAPRAAAPRASQDGESPPPTPARKSVPGAHLPDAAHELAAPLDHDPLHSASLLEKAEQAAGRGERALALSLAIKSYHAQPNADALRVAGELACKLGDAGKARWARDHLVPGERGSVEAACKAADLTLE